MSFQLTTPRSASKARVLSPSFDITSWTIEAGPSYFDGAGKEVESGIKAAADQILERDKAPYSTVK
jgi:hypothetical protein